jgi:hypothetical protein
VFLCVSGRNGGIRTHDPYHPKVVHYQAVLRPGESNYTHVRSLCHTENTLFAKRIVQLL